jgi:AcrR family transcriptional regulator
MATADAEAERMGTERTASGGAALRTRVTDAITEAAFAELAETGYARMSMEAVARRAGVGKAALYRRWSSKQGMLVDLIRQAVQDALPQAPDTGALHTDLRASLANVRGQLANPMVASVIRSLLAEVRQDGALADMLLTVVAQPRRAAAHALVQAAIDRGELPASVDRELAADLVIAPLGFRMLIMNGDSDDAYIETLATAIEAGLKAAAR